MHGLVCLARPCVVLVGCAVLDVQGISYTATDGRSDRMDSQNAPIRIAGGKCICMYVDVNVFNLPAISEQDFDKRRQPGPQAKGVNHNACMHDFIGVCTRTLTSPTTGTTCIRLLKKQRKNMVITPDPDGHRPQRPYGQGWGQHRVRHRQQLRGIHYTRPFATQPQLPGVVASVDLSAPRRRLANAEEGGR